MSIDTEEPGLGSELVGEAHERDVTAQRLVDGLRVLVDARPVLHQFDQFLPLAGRPEADVVAAQ